MTVEPNESHPCDVLRAEHRTILRVLETLGVLVERFEAGGDFDRSALLRAVEFFRLFADACHHAKEEDLLFPALEARGIPREGGPIGVMLAEHAIAREHTREMAAALEARDRGEAGAESAFCAAARAYRSLLTQHIFKEDNILFRMGERVLGPDDTETLRTGFCETRCRAFDGKRGEELARMADELEAHVKSSGGDSE